MPASEQRQPSLVRKTVSELVVAEVFLVQATLESAGVIGEGISDLGKQLYWSESDTPPKEPMKTVLLRTRDDVVESYTSRFNYLRKLLDSDS